MKGATSIQERLWELRKDKGLNLEELSKLTGISKSALGSYEKEDFKEINHGNLITLADFYGVSVDYLLCRTENREQINTPLTELHLNDEMVALLKSGRINNRLLCELATHKDFIKFLADIEIYVDGIATMQIQNLNALVDTVRHEIIEHRNRTNHKTGRHGLLENCWKEEMNSVGVLPVKPFVRASYTYSSVQIGRAHV